MRKLNLALYLLAMLSWVIGSTAMAQEGSHRVKATMIARESSLHTSVNNRDVYLLRVTPRHGEPFDALVVDNYRVAQQARLTRRVITGYFASRLPNDKAGVGEAALDFIRTILGCRLVSATAATTVQEALDRSWLASTRASLNRLPTCVTIERGTCRVCPFHSRQSFRAKRNPTVSLPELEARLIFSKN